MNVDLTGKTVLFHGATSPLRSALETAFVANGAIVENLDRASDAPTVPVYALINCSIGANGLPSADHSGISEISAFAAITRALAPRLQRVINVFSTAGLVPIRGLLEFSAAQAGLVALTRTLAMELGPTLRVNAVAIGALDGDSPAERMLGHTALRRPGTHAEIVAAALFLADPDNGYMTGHTLNVDGGWAVGYARNF